uniref:HEPN domain-containing protein n=1 Tax=Candidatus Kentrum sp. SD TaxID=2126332 RepID=A0A450YSY3_9GAMM|nr:MAG: HEPN domain-containing protein [Candidatus Kentron sp. SD]VFK49616.1 MAG: HEPN domain-containing protein [Candidatus Kentron sp. SD]VFK79632.1 MAG: HEPN domain-containing protein [Candidatus Kentron sp. SD]
MNPEVPENGCPISKTILAKSDLALARTDGSPDIMPQMLCFHAQQAAEKALKAVLLSGSIDFPNTHNLRILLDKIPSRIEIPPEIEDAALLTDYAVSSNRLYRKYSAGPHGSIGRGPTPPDLR